MFQQTLCRDFKYCQPCAFVYLKGFRSDLGETLVEMKKIAKLQHIRRKALCLVSQMKNAQVLLARAIRTGTYRTNYKLINKTCVFLKGYYDTNYSIKQQVNF